MMHTYLSRNGLDCSFDDFKSAYLAVEKEISAETACTLEEPHFSVYVERVLARLGAKLKAQTHLAMQLSMSSPGSSHDTFHWIPKRSKS
jgi:hypothetical protein